jgi:hypothetical protein
MSSEDKFLHPLLTAAAEGNVEKVKELLEQDAELDVNFRDPENNYSAFLISVWKRNSLPMLEYLKSKGADLTARNKWGEGALHLACYGEEMEIFKWLLEMKDDAGEYVYSVDLKTEDHQKTPIHYCYHLPKIEMLLSRGADINSVSVKHETALQLRCDNGVSQLNLIRAMLQRGADPNVEDMYGHTPLFSAARNNAVECIKILVEEGNANVSHTDKKGRSAVDEADRYHMNDAAVWLWLAGASTKNLKKAEKFNHCSWIRPYVINSPSARHSAKTFVFDNNVYIFGGRGYGKGVLNDLPDSKNAKLTMASLQDVMVSDLSKMETTMIIPADEISFKTSNKLNDKRCGPVAKIIGEDSLTIEGIVPPNSAEEDEVACVQAVEPFTPEDKYGYFEVTVLETCGDGQFIGVGLAEADYDLTDMPGWYGTSYGYHSDDGRAFHGFSSQGIQWGPQYGTKGNVAGCGINYETREVFFTLNGEFLGVAYKAVPLSTYYPTVGVGSKPGVKVSFNFGAQPFKFNFEVRKMKFEDVSISNELPNTFYFDQILPINQQTTINERPAMELIQLLDTSSLLQCFSLVQFTDTNTYEWLHSKAVRIGVWRIDRPESQSKKTPQVQYARDEERDIIYVLLYCDKFIYFYIILDTYQSANTLTGLVDTEKVELLKQRIVELLNEQTPKSTATVWKLLQNKLLLVVNNNYLEIDVPSFEFTERTTSGIAPFLELPVTTQVNDYLITFGGWDGKEMNSELHFFNTKTATWSIPQINPALIVPRARNNYCAGVFEDGKVLTKNYELVQSTAPAVVYFGGWNGRGPVDDLEILFIESKNESDALEYALNNKDLHDFTIKIADKVIYANKIVLYSRSSFFRELFEKDLSQSDIALDVAYELFYPLIQYWHTDNLNLGLLEEDKYRLFVKTSDKYSPEHSRRLAEEIISSVVSAPSTMASDMARALGETEIVQKMHDIEFLVENTVVAAHKAIICARSEFFRRMLLGNLKESKMKRIPIPETDLASFKIVFEYLYKNEVNLDEISDQIVDVLVTASQFGVTKLKNSLESVICFNLNEENVLSLFLLADQHHAMKLRDSCVQFIRQHGGELENQPDYAKILEEISN